MGHETHDNEVVEVKDVGEPVDEVVAPVEETKPVEEIKAVDEPKGEEPPATVEEPNPVEEPTPVEETKPVEPDKEEVEVEADTTPLVEEVKGLQFEKEALLSTIKDLENNVETYEAVIRALVDTKKEAVPAEYAELVPEGTPIAQLDWLNKAEAKGLFNKANAQIEIGRQSKVHKVAPDSNVKLTATQKLSNSFGEIFGKQ